MWHHLLAKIENGNLFEKQCVAFVASTDGVGGEVFIMKLLFCLKIVGFYLVFYFLIYFYKIKFFLLKSEPTVTRWPGCADDYQVPG